ncbi:MAG: hypothetical protein AAGE90_20660 [Pseudomonadota bacterium]
MNALERQLATTRSTTTWKIVKALDDGRRSPGAFLALPARIVSLLIDHRRAKQEVSTSFQAAGASSDEVAKPSRRMPAVVFCATNGVGLGHFTRLRAIARSLRASAPDIPIVFVVSTPLVHVTRLDGFTTYYVPPKQDVVAATNTAFWESFLESTLRSVLRAHRARAFVFDGVFPTEPVLAAMENAPDCRRIWVMRGLPSAEVAETRQGYLERFERLIRPAEAGAAVPEATTRDFHCPPIVSVRRDDLVERASARARLGLPDDRLVAYIQLGAGVQNDTAPALKAAVAALEARGVLPVLAASVLSDLPIDPPSGARILRDYPTAESFEAFDFAVSAGGYNTFHELMLTRTPSILVPRQGRVNEGDRQLDRVMIAVDAGAALLVEEGEGGDALRTAMDDAVGALSEKETRQTMREAAGRLMAGAEGSAAAAGEILRLYQEGAHAEEERHG